VYEFLHIPKARILPISTSYTTKKGEYLQEEYGHCLSTFQKQCEDKEAPYKKEAYTRMAIEVPSSCQQAYEA